MDEEAGAFDFHSHIGDHSLDHFKGSDGFAELDADFGVFTAGAESRFGNADGNGADERTGSVQGIHGDTEAVAFPAETVFDRHEAVLEDEFCRIGSADAHFVFSFADGEARSPLADDEGCQSADAAALAGIGEDDEDFGQGPVGNEAFRTVEDIALAIFGLHGTRRNGTGIGTSPRFGQGESSQVVIVDDVEVAFLLVIVAGNDDRIRSQGIGSHRRSDTGTAFA